MANKQAVSRSIADVSLGTSGYLVLRLGLESDVHLVLVRPAVLPGGGMLFSVSPSPISSGIYLLFTAAAGDLPGHLLPDCSSRQCRYSF